MNDARDGVASLLLLDHSFLGLGPGRGRRSGVRGQPKDFSFELADPSVRVGVFRLEFADSRDQNFAFASKSVHLKFELFGHLHLIFNLMIILVENLVIYHDRSN